MPQKASEAESFLNQLKSELQLMLGGCSEKEDLRVLAACPGGQLKAQALGCGPGELVWVRGTDQDGCSTQLITHYTNLHVVLTKIPKHPKKPRGETTFHYPPPRKESIHT